MNQQERIARTEVFVARDIEFCNICFEETGFPISTHINAAIRFRNGASYTEGSGQTCGTCNQRIAARQKEDYCGSARPPAL